MFSLKIRTLVISTVLLFLGGIVACGGGSKSSILLSIQELLERSISRGLVGVAVYVEQASRPSVIYKAGVQDQVNATPYQSNSQFKIASISKLFIALSVTRLAIQQQLSLDDTLADWLPEYATRIEYSDSITLRLLVQHRSGIPDFDSQIGFSWQESHTNIEQTLEYALDKPADFVPNQQYAYSNTNYLLLGKILDKVLGYSHHLFIQDEFLVPLSMSNTVMLLSDTDITRLARGYWDGIDRTEQDYRIPGGSMVSTISDIGRFIRALNTGGLLTAEEKAIYRTLYSFGHSGWLPGYQSSAYYDSSIDAVVVQFVNSTGGNSEQLANQLYQDIMSALK